MTNTNAGALAAGDVITTVDGTAITSESDIKNILQKKEAGDTVAIQYWRNGAYGETELTLISADTQADG